MNTCPATRRAAAFCLLVFFLAPRALFAQYDTALTITEVMFHAPAGDNEYIEIFNTSKTRSFDLYGYKIRYANGGADFIYPAASSSILPPQKFAVIFEADYSLQTGIYKNIIPADALILKISDGAFGTNGMSNSTGQSIQLLAPYYDTLDVYTYSADNQQGYSDEKIVLSKNNNPANWKNAYYYLGSPGKRNSVTPYNYDLWTRSFLSAPPAILPGQAAQLQLSISNTGIYSADTFHIQIFKDANRDSVPQTSELFATRSNLSLAANDSAAYAFPFSSADTGAYYFIAKITFAKDENLLNNTAFTRVRVYAVQIPARGIVVNEIMYGPSSPQPEWIELYNRTNAPLNLRKCRISDRLTTVSLPDIAIPVPAGGYIVCAADSTVRQFYTHAFSFITVKLPVFNNDSDWVVLRDSLGNTIDEVHYSSAWGGRGGFSLERRFADSASQSASNWTTCSSTLKATPGQKNTAVPKIFDAAIDSFYTQSSYILPGSSVQLKCVIANKGVSAIASASVGIYNDTNRDSLPQENELLQSRQLPPISAGASVSAAFAITGLPLGSHTLIARVNAAGDEDTTNNKGFTRLSVISPGIQRGDLVIHEIMHSPPFNQPEWIEVYNRSPRTVNLKKFFLADAADTALVTLLPLEIPPLSFAVIAKDSAIKTHFSFTAPLLVSVFPQLNNAGDKVILLDSLSRVIDSLEYQASWGGASGYSLERVLADSSSLASGNWRTCASTLRGTPGKKNTASPKDVDVSVDKLQNTRQYFEIGEAVLLRCMVSNRGKFAVPYQQIQFFFDANGDSLIQPVELILTETVDDIQPAATRMFDATLQGLPSGRHRIFAAAARENDEDTTNNIAVCIVTVIPPNEIRGDIVLNEIMYAPQAGEPEWIELYNKSTQQRNIRGFGIADFSDTVIIKTQPLVLPPLSFAVVARDSTVTSRYQFSAPLIFAPLPVLNNDGDRIMLLDSLGRVIDSLVYEPAWGGSNGYSLERIAAEANSADSLNWKTCAYNAKGTPGRVNSVTKKNIDLALTACSTIPTRPARGDTVALTCVVSNRGYDFSGGTVFIYKTSMSGDSLIFTSAHYMLFPDSSVVIHTPQTCVLHSQTQFRFVLKCETDEDTSNNRYLFAVQPSARKHDILISEIMLAPVNDEPEWIELFNNSGAAVNLFHWSIRDSLTTPSTTVINREYNLPPGGYVVVARDSAVRQYYGHPIPLLTISVLPVLNNSADGLRLYDPTGAEVDSLFYEIQNNPLGLSLERYTEALAWLPAGGWDLCRSRWRATPGYINSIVQKENDGSVESIRITPAFPVAGDSIQATAYLFRTGPAQVLNGQLEFTFREADNIVSLQNKPFSSPLSIVPLAVNAPIPVLFTGKKLEITARFTVPNDPDTSNDYQVIQVNSGTASGSVVFSEIMFSPRSGEPEWIELYNTSDARINIYNWFLTHPLKPSGSLFFTQQDRFIEAKSYMVVASDSIRGLSEPYIIASFGTLHNDEDSIVLRNRFGQMVDGAGWDKNSLSLPGSSFERRLSKLSLPNHKQWHFSLSPQGSTPGKQNAVEQINNPGEKALLITEIMYEPGEGNCEYVELYNTSGNAAQLGGTALYVNGTERHILTDTLLELPSGAYFVLAADSSLYARYPVLRGNKFVRTEGKTSLGLTNSGAKLTIAGVDGMRYDSVAYSPSMHAGNTRQTADRALERINLNVPGSDARNWSTAAGNGGSPGEQNSIKISGALKESALSCEPNPFSPDNDGFEDFTSINYILPFASAYVTIRIFDELGRPRKKVTDNELTPGRGSIIYNGLDDNGNPLRLGMYILLLEARDAQSAKTAVLKYILVSARKL